MTEWEAPERTPSGSDASLEQHDPLEAPPDSSSTDREKEREQENQRFVPVILKRTDEARRHPDDILQAAIDEGLEQLERPAFSLLLSAIAAGLILGFTAMSVAVIQAATSPLDSPLLTRIATAIVYPFGFVVCIMSGTELFTEHTATAVYPILDRRAPVRRLLRLWTIVGLGNLIGTLVSACLLTAADQVVGARDGYLEVGRHLVAFDLGPLLVSSLLAGWLMALGAWLILATPPAVSQLLSIYVVTFLIGVGGLHHSIAGSAEAFTALLIGDEISLSEAAYFVSVALAGNLLGGSVFVAGLNYAHIRKSQAG